MGDTKGKFIQCKCKSCYIDETEHYCRIGGNFVDIEAVIDFTEYNNLITENQKLKSTLEKINNYINNLPFKDLIPVEVKVIKKIIEESDVK